MLKNFKKNLSLLLKAFNSEAKNLEKFIKEEKRFYYQRIGDNFLKVRIKEGKKVLKELKTEIELYKTFRKRFKRRFFPKLISFGKYKNLDWLLEKGEEGIFGGEMEKDFAIKKDFLKKISPKDLAKKIFLYQKTKPKIDLYLHGGWWFGKDFECHRKRFLENFIDSKLNQNFLSRKEINLAQEIINKNKKFLDEEAKFLCHGDLYPNNLVLNESKNLIILDWGLSTFNNSAFDVAFIYLMAQASAEWQRKFLKSFFNLVKDKEKFKELFKIDLISLSNRFASQCYNLKLKKGLNKKVFLIFKNYLRFFKKAISKKYESFIR
jgi:thiamine kinase-like enzyme